MVTNYEDSIKNLKGKEKKIKATFTLDPKVVGIIKAWLNKEGIKFSTWLNELLSNFAKQVKEEGKNGNH